MSVQPRTTKAQRRKKRIRKVLLVILLMIAALAAGVFYLRRQVQTEFSTRSQDEVKSAQVTSGSIRTTVSGSGRLVSEGLTDVSCPAGISIQQLLVEEGDSVKAGQPVARVAATSVMSALSSVQSKLEELDSELKTASSDAVSSQVKTAVAGRLKAVFAQKGESVVTVMHRDGALALLSLDGYMAARFESEDYQPGDSVSVLTSDGKTYPGTVSQVQGGITTVLLTDNGPAYRDTVTIDERFTAELEINQPFKITGYAGTVSYMNYPENSQLYAGSIVMTLTDTSYSANYNLILEQRKELEGVLQQLIELYQSGVISANADGVIDSISETSASVSSGNSSIDYTQTQTILTIDPEKEMSVTISVDETDILSLQIGQTVAITVESIGSDQYSGTVTEIDTTATSSSGVTWYSAKILLPRADGMMAGMTATASVTIQGVENVLLVPDDAVKKTSASTYVYTTYDEETGELGGTTQVTTGMSNGTYTEIMEGLQEGDTVYYTPKKQQNSFSGFGGNGGFGGGMPGNFSGGNNSGNSGSRAPGGNSGGNAPGGNSGGNSGFGASPGGSSRG